MNSNDVNNETVDNYIDGMVVVVAKCPIQGKSKTRLIPLLGPDGSVDLAKAMLSDVVLTIDKCPQLRLGVNKVLLYAPGNDDGLQRMKTILDELSIPYHGGGNEIHDQQQQQQQQRRRPRDHENQAESEKFRREWTLLPMMMNNDVGGGGGAADGDGDGDLRSSDLGSKLQDALVRARELMRMRMTTTASGGKSEKDDRGRSFRSGVGGGGGVVFLGMDSPVLSLDDIVQGLQDSSGVSSSSSFHNQACSSSSHSTTTTSTATPQLSAMLCPADDGGYGMLCVPPTADPSVTFQDVYWSHPLTAVSQIKALTDQGIMVKIGKCMNDIDEPDDVRALCKRLAVPTTAVETNDDGEDHVSSNNDNNNNNHHQKLIATKNLHRRSTTTATNHSTAGIGVVVSSHHPTCYYTKLALQRSGMLP